ncbi:hypothetical protein LY76DRAFT_65344 [Colletotrichum caudatum]|nr:hypothetical protein LY76DRAFT_65344 [Colletotrichum caudatum]
MIPTSEISPTRLPQDGTVRKLPSLPGERTHYTPRTLDQLVSLVTYLMNVHTSSLPYLTPYHTYLPTYLLCFTPHLTYPPSACSSTIVIAIAHPSSSAPSPRRRRPDPALTRRCLPRRHRSHINLTPPPTASSLPPHRVPLHYTRRPSVGARFLH